MHKAHCSILLLLHEYIEPIDLPFKLISNFIVSLLKLHFFKWPILRLLDKKFIKQSILKHFFSFFTAPSSTIQTSLTRLFDSSAEISTTKAKQHNGNCKSFPHQCGPNSSGSIFTVYPINLANEATILNYIDFCFAVEFKVILCENKYGKV